MKLLGQPAAGVRVAVVEIGKAAAIVHAIAVIVVVEQIRGHVAPKLQTRRAGTAFGRSSRSLEDTS